MSKPFTPHRPQEIVVVQITKREAVLVQKLRRYAFGKFTIHKADGLLVRVEIQDSQVIDEGTELEL